MCLLCLDLPKPGPVCSLVPLGQITQCSILGSPFNYQLDKHSGPEQGKYFCVWVFWLHHVCAVAMEFIKCAWSKTSESNNITAVLFLIIGLFSIHLDLSPLLLFCFLKYGWQVTLA